MKVNICGIIYDVVELSNNFDVDLHMGQIEYGKALIKINKDLNEQIKNNSLCHEMLHGMLIHLGYDELSGDEKFVTALAGAINQGFKIREVEQ